MSGAAKILFSASLAFMAFLPATLSIMMDYYSRRRNSGQPARELKRTKNSILVVSIALILTSLVYFLSLDMIIDYTSLDAFDGVWLTTKNLAYFILSLSVLLIDSGIFYFVKDFFDGLDD